VNFTKEQVQDIISRIELELGKRGIKKYDFYKESGVSSSLYSQWNTGKKQPTSKKLGEIANFLDVSLEYLIYGREEEKVSAEDKDVMELREELRRRPETKILFHASKNAPASAILEAAALIERYKEESKYK